MGSGPDINTVLFFKVQKELNNRFGALRLVMGYVILLHILYALIVLIEVEREGSWSRS